MQVQILLWSGVWVTEGHDDGAGDAVGHHHREDVHHPGVRRSELKLVGLMLRDEKVF